MVPSLLSLLCHATLLLFLTATFRGGAGGGLGRGPAGFTTLITVEGGTVAEPWGDRPDAQVEGEANDVPPGDVPAGSPAGSELLSQASHLKTETPPGGLLLPSADGPLKTGTGTNLPTGVGMALPRGSVESAGGMRPAARGTRGSPDGVVGGGASGGGFGAGFLGLHDEGMKVVYVIDASGSMTSYNAMQVAKAQLMASLQGLDERQQFLIIFYDDKPHVLQLKDEPKPALANATEINKTLAKQKIAGIEPGAGTDHVPALELALHIRPDVIFFLTDAAEPPLWPRELDHIKNTNAGKTHIHSIEFGQGPEVASDNDQRNFLRRLASQNGGTYRYHDVTKFKTQ